MSFNKRISKFLVGLTLASSIISSVGFTQVFAMEDSNEDIRIKDSDSEKVREKVIDLALKQAEDGLSGENIDTLEIWISKCNYLYVVAANYFKDCTSQKKVSFNFTGFFNTCDSICRNPENQTTTTFGKVVSVTKDIFNLNNNKSGQNDYDGLLNRLKGYYAVLLYCDARKFALDVPEFVVKMIQKFDTNCAIQSLLTQL